jgi:anti-sigma regulatory factor (Ser/Thr protein kinase)
LVNRPEAVLLSPHPSNVHVARDHVRQTLSRTRYAPRVDDAVLAVSELVANVVMHARTDCEVSVRAYPDVVCVAVRDFCASMPVRQTPNAEAMGGRGLLLVAELSDDFGVDVMDVGKVVWFSILAAGQARRGGLGDADHR